MPESRRCNNKRPSGSAQCQGAASRPAKVFRGTATHPRSDTACFTCAICLEDLTVQLRTAAGQCGHGFCTQCMGTHVQTMVRERRFPLRCPQPGCVQQMSTTVAASLLQSPTDVDALQLLEVLSAIPEAQRFYCPNPACSCIMVIDEQVLPDRASTCHSCSQAVCGSCKVLWHHGMTCVEYQAQPAELRKPEDVAVVEQQAQELGWKACPCCKTMVELAHGCYHIVCKCGADWCYKCGQQWHDRTARCGCTLWDTSNVALEQAFRVRHYRAHGQDEAQAQELAAADLVRYGLVPPALPPLPQHVLQQTFGPQLQLAGMLAAAAAAGGAKKICANHAHATARVPLGLALQQLQQQDSDAAASALFNLAGAGMPPAVGAAAAGFELAQGHMDPAAMAFDSARLVAAAVAQLEKPGWQALLGQLQAADAAGRAANNGQGDLAAQQHVAEQREFQLLRWAEDRRLREQVAAFQAARQQQQLALQLQAAAWAAHSQAAAEHMQQALYSQHQAQLHAALHAQLQAQLDMPQVALQMGSKERQAAAIGWSGEGGTRVPVGCRSLKSTAAAASPAVSSTSSLSSASTYMHMPGARQHPAAIWEDTLRATTAPAAVAPAFELVHQLQMVGRLPVIPEQLQQAYGHPVKQAAAFVPPYVRSAMTHNGENAAVAAATAYALFPPFVPPAAVPGLM